MKTNAARNEKDLKALARDLTKEHFGGFLTIAIMLFSILVISLLPGLFNVGFLFITIPFFLLPAVFAALMKSRGVPARDAPNYRETFQMFGAYYLNPWRGVFRAFRLMVLCALIWIVVSMASGVIYLGLSSSIDPAFATAYDVFQNKAETVSNSGELMEIMMEFASSPEAASFEKFTLGFSSGVVGYFFVHQVSLASFVAELHFLFDGKAQYLDNRIFYGAFRNIRPQFTGVYWRYFYFMPILYVVGFVGSYLLGSHFIENAYVLPMVGFAGAGFLFLFALPYYWNLLMVLGLYFEIPVSEIIIGQGHSAIEQMANTPGVPKQVLDQTKETVRILEEVLTAKKEALKETPKTDKKDEGSAK